MKNIYLVRHGQSLGNVDKSVYASKPDHAIPMSKLGFEQARKAGGFLKDEFAKAGREADAKTRIWLSPYQRTRQTARCLYESLSQSVPNLDMREHINLCEQQFGLFDGVPEEELSKRFPLESAHYDLAATNEGKFWPRMPMGESRFDVAIRVHQAFGTFQRDDERNGVSNLIVVCHGVSFRAFVMQWRHLPYEWFEQEPNPGNCHIYHLGEDEGRDRKYVYQG